MQGCATLRHLHQLAVRVCPERLRRTERKHRSERISTAMNARPTNPKSRSIDPRATPIDNHGRERSTRAASPASRAIRSLGIGCCWGGWSQPGRVAPAMNVDTIRSMWSTTTAVRGNAVIIDHAPELPASQSSRRRGRSDPHLVTFHGSTLGSSWCGRRSTPYCEVAVRGNATRGSCLRPRAPQLPRCRSHG